MLYLGHKLLDGRLGTRADLALHLPDDGTPDPPVPFGGASEDDHLAVTSCRRKSRAKSGEPATIAGYLGNGAAFDRALLHFADAYAELNLADHGALLHAIANRIVPTKPDGAAEET